MPGALSMVFKGGTSLSKAHNLIERFSEDVDITIAYNQLTRKDPFSLTKTQQKVLTEELRNSLKSYIKNTIKEYLSEEIRKEVNVNYEVKISSDGESIEIDFDSVCSKRSTYIHPYVLLEFGARNAITPNNIHLIKPYVEVSSLEFPVASVNVLVAERTFWEKATLIHVACNRGIFTKGAPRLSRHWYDLATLYKSPVYSMATASSTILEDVVKHKKVFYNTAYAHYDKCISGEFSLIPSGSQLKELEDDYDQMVNSGMFYGTPLTFGEIIKSLKKLTGKLNSK